MPRPTLAAAFVLIAASASAQADRPVPSFESGTELIQVDVVVTGPGGARALDLTREDFVLLEEGRAQEITHFALRATPAASGGLSGRPSDGTVQVEPRKLLVLVDTLGMEAETLLRARASLLPFADRLEPGDEVALMTTGGLLLQPFTAERGEWRAGVNRLSASALAASPVLERPPMTTHHAFLILGNDRGARTDYLAQLRLEDPDLVVENAVGLMEGRARRILAVAAQNTRDRLAALSGVIDQLHDVPGRKALALVSEGFFTQGEDKIAVRDLTAAAARSGVVIHVLDPRGLVARSPVGDASVGGDVVVARSTERYVQPGIEADRQILNALARDTGGLTGFNRDLGAALDRVVADTATGYLLGYQRPAESRRGGFRRLEVKLRRTSLQVRAPRGYLAPEGRVARPPRLEPVAHVSPRGTPFNTTLRDALVSVAPRRELGVELAAAPLDTDGGPSVVIATRFAAGAGEGEPGPANLELLGVVYDDGGRPLLTFGDARTVDRTARITFDTAAALGPGAYQVRVAATDGTRLGTAVSWVDVPDRGKGELALTPPFLAPPEAPLRPVFDRQAFIRGEEARFAVFATNVKGDGARHADVLFETRLTDGERPVAADPPFEVRVPAEDARPGRVGYAHSVDTGRLAPGTYTLFIRVSDRIGRASVEKSVRFRIE